MTTEPNPFQLTLRQWVTVGLITVGIIVATPQIWKRVESFETLKDYRVPFALSKDYWLYQRHLKNQPEGSIFVVGDSVVWGEYVRENGTWSHFLNETGGTERFVNAGVNGLHPLALEGLIKSFGGALHGKKVLLHCNLLWSGSPEQDLSTEKEQTINHARLVPQFTDRPPAYHAPLEERLSHVVRRGGTFFRWVDHLQNVSFENRSLPQWTLLSDSNGKYSNAYKFPFAAIKSTVLLAPVDDPERGPESPRHQSWEQASMRATVFDWVPLEQSQQWAAFQRLVGYLQARSDVFVIVGPLNEAMINVPDRSIDEAMTWLQSQTEQVEQLAALSGDLYADASHPLTNGYLELAQELLAKARFKDWLARNPR